MKNRLLIGGALIATLFISIKGYAVGDGSSDTTTVKAVQGNWGMTLNLNGLIDRIQLNNFQDSITENAILIRYYKSDKIVYRIGFGINMINRKTTVEDSLKIDQQLMIQDSIYKQSAYSFSFGIEKHLGNSKRLDPYIGVQAQLGLIGKTKIDVDTKIESSTGTNSITRDYVLDGGSMLAIHFIGGFNYFIADKFSLGAEYLLGYTTIKRGGNYSDIIVNTPASGSSSSTIDKGEISTRSAQLIPTGSANITLSYFF